MILSPSLQLSANWRKSRYSGLRTVNNVMDGKTGLGIYEDFLEVKSDLDFGAIILETMLLNGQNRDVNRYLEKALPLMRQAFSYMADAEFELFTSPPEMFEG